MASPLVHVDADDQWITTITLNRPEKRNALSVVLIEALRDAVLDASADLRRRVLIVRGKGPAFCAGLDLHEAQSAIAQRSAEALAELYLAICKCPLVTIAAVHGAAMGGGAGLVAACDLAVAAQDMRLAFPEVRRGLVAALVTCMLHRQFCERAVREMILLSREIKADEAYSLGLVTQVAEPELLDNVAAAVAHEACQGAPGAVARTKRLLDDLSARSIEADIQLALRYHLAGRHSAEAAEGIEAFMMKRPPNWPPRPPEPA